MAAFWLFNMAYTNSPNDRMDELRFRSQQSPRNESSLLGGLVSPPRNGNRVSQQQGLTRRFTTDSGRVPTVASLASQRGGGGGQDQEYGPSVRQSISYRQHLLCFVPNTTSSSHLLHLSPFTCIDQLLNLYNTDLPFADVPQSPTCKNSSVPNTSRSNSP